MKLFNSFKEYVFRNLFPRYYKDYDTYKDEKGRGILERFIEVLSEYLDVSITPEIDNAIDLIDLEKAQAIYLNYLWEFFGEIPYAYGVVVGEEEFSEKNLQRWLEANSGTFPRANPREVIGYAISLYKIRGTRLFYEVLARFYGWRVLIDELPEGIDPDTYFEEIREADSHIIVQCYPDRTRPIGDRLIGMYYPGGTKFTKWYDDRMGWGFTTCGQCTRLRFQVFIPRGQYKKLMAVDGTGEYFKNIKKLMAGIFQKYLPIQVEDLVPDINFFVYPDGYPELIPQPGDPINYNTLRAKVWVDDYITNLNDNN